MRYRLLDLFTILVRVLVQFHVKQRNHILLIIHKSVDLLAFSHVLDFGHELAEDHLRDLYHLGFICLIRVIS